MARCLLFRPGAERRPGELAGFLLRDQLAGIDRGRDGGGFAGSRRDLELSADGLGAVDAAGVVSADWRTTGACDVWALGEGVAALVQADAPSALRARSITGVRRRGDRVIVVTSCGLRAAP
jgi:hypothetical protein